MKAFKKLLLAVCIFSIFICPLSVCGKSAPDIGSSCFCISVKGVTYELHDDSTASVITATSTKNVKIASVVTYDGNRYVVRSISDKAFYKNKNITKITIPSSVTEIGSYSFYGCSNLRQVVFNTKSLKTVGRGAFLKVNKKASVTVPSGKVRKYKKLLRNKISDNIPISTR